MVLVTLLSCVFLALESPTERAPESQMFFVSEIVFARALRLDKVAEVVE